MTSFSLLPVADVFIVQYWREADESVLEQMRALAMARSVVEGRQVWYCLIDGYDSRRIVEAYPDAFAASPPKRNGRRRRTRRR